MTQRCSQRKKASPAIVISDDEKFVAVAANDKCVASLLLFWSHDLQGFLILLSSTALATMRRPLMISDHQHLDTDDDDKDTSQKKR